MIKSTNIDCYYDGYKTSEINCVDLPIAACAGHFNRDNYFLYCMCYNYILNWASYFEEDWLSLRKKLLSYLKLDFQQEKAKDKNELFEKVTSCIAGGQPVILIVKYGSLVYSKYYKWGTYDHGLIVSDFNDENRTFGIRDREAVREHINAGIFTSDIMHRIQINYDQLGEIWDYSNKLFKDEQSIHYKHFYYLKSSVTDKIVNPVTLINKLMDDKTIPLENQLKNYALKLNEKISGKNEIKYVEEENVRRIFHRSFFIFTDVIKRYFPSDNEKCNKWLYTAFEVFLNNRLSVFNMLHLYALRNMQFPIDELERLLKKDTEYFMDLKNNVLNFINKGGHTHG